MASIITADSGGVSGSAGIKQSADSSGILALATGTGTTAVTIDASQNVGIGVVPSAWGSNYAKTIQISTQGAYVAANTASYSAGTYAWFGNNAYLDSSAVFRYTTSTASAQYAQVAGAHQWFNAPSGTAGNAISFTQAMTLDSSGNLLVGVTSATGKLGVNGDGSQRIANFKNTAGTDATLFGIYVAKFQNDSSTSQRYIGFSYNNDGNGGGQINGNGASQAAFGSFSDIRLKENVVDLSPQLEKVLALRPVEFDYKTGGHQTGFIAQEMQQVFPDAVGDDGSEDHYLTVTGWNKTEAILVKAIQEQQALITTLTERLDALEAK